MHSQSCTVCQCCYPLVMVGCDVDVLEGGHFFKKRCYYGSGARVSSFFRKTFFCPCQFGVHIGVL